MRKYATSSGSWLLEGFDRALFVASHFGFIPIEPPRVTDEDARLTSDFKEEISTRAHVLQLDPREIAALLRSYAERDFASLPHPLSISYKKNQDYYLHIIGIGSGLGEAILIRTALSILLEKGYKGLSVDVNCLGDKDSLAAYERELHNYLRKTGADLKAETKQVLKKDIFKKKSIYAISWGYLLMIQKSESQQLSCYLKEWK